MHVNPHGMDEQAARSTTPGYPRLRHAVCLRVRYGSQYCKGCVDACPHDALTLAPDDSLPRLNRLFCTSCGQCAATCPVEAWNFVLIEQPPNIADGTEKGHDPQPNGREVSPLEIEISCRRAQTAPQNDSAEAESCTPNDQSTRVTIPCVLGMSGGQVAAYQSSAETTVWLQVGDCLSCPDGRQEEQRQRPYLLATFIPRVHVRVKKMAPTSGSDSAATAPSWAEARVSRKLLLGTAAAALAGAFVARVSPGQSKILRTEESDLTLSWHREIFLTSLVREGTVKGSDARLAGLNSLTVTDEGVCDGCGLCVRSCPTEALAFRDSTLELLPERCVGCGVCIVRCPQGVLANADRVDLSTLGQPVTLTPIPAGRCPCGAPALPHTLPKRPRCQNCARAESLLHDLTASTKHRPT